MVTYYFILTRKTGKVEEYVRNTLQCCLNSIIKTDSKPESLCVDIKDGSQTLVMGLMYRPPNATNEISSLLCQVINRAAARYSQVCVMGDFNHRNVDWSLMIGNKEIDEFLKVIQDNFSKQVILEPTRGSNILD